ncbi:MAG: BMP family ABC transporter substrate-binding protein [Eubacteriales bacterium]|nr:BMP family ABC transporter substrate-binding protein [Eubacteriales bacterium]
MKNSLRKLSLVAMSALLALVGCKGGDGSSSSAEKMEVFELPETNIGTKTTPTADKLSSFTEAAPLKLGLVTDSGTLNDHSFNESAWDGINEFATENGGGTINTSSNSVETGKIQTHYVQPASGQYTTAGRKAAIDSVISWGAKVVVLPGYLFESVLARIAEDEAKDANSKYKDVCFLALDCTKSDDDNNYAQFEYTKNMTSVIYREEQSGFLAGYAAVKEGYRKLGFLGGMAVPAVIRYGSGYCQGADVAAKELNLGEGAIEINHYYAGQFAATDTATSYCTNWYNSGTEVIFGCGGAVYNSILSALATNQSKKWIGVDVNQHADTTLKDYERNNCITSAMKNLKATTKILLSTYVDNDQAWSKDLAGNVVTVGAQSDNCVLPTPETTGDKDCWGFKKFTIAEYNTLLGKLKNGSVKVNSFSKDDVLAANNYGCDNLVKVHHIEA